MLTQRREEKRVGERPSTRGSGQGEKKSSCIEVGGVVGGERKRERPRPFGSSFYMSFPSPGPALCKLGYPAVLFVLPEVLTPVLGPFFVLFLVAFPFLIF